MAVVRALRGALCPGYWDVSQREVFSCGDATIKHGCQRKRDGTFSMFGWIDRLEDSLILLVS